MTILAPKELEQPFLLYRKKNGTVILALCRECAEAESLECKHSEKDRAFTATYMISEVEFALFLGYKIVHIFEAHCYTQSEFILKEFIQFLNCLKLKSTNCFKECVTLKDKEVLLSLINEMNPEITLEDICPNAAKRNFYKLMCNALFGKFIQRTDKPKSTYVNTQDEINMIFYAGNRITDFYCITDDVCLINTEINALKLNPNRTHNIYIGSQITAYARETIYKEMLKLLQIPQCKMYQIECDSIFFSLPTDVPINLKLSPCLGDFKNVFDGEIIEFYSLGQKQYCINYLDSVKLNSTFKISGLSLKSQYNSDQLNQNTFEEFLDTFIEGANTAKVFSQQRSKSDFVQLKVISYQQKYTFTNRLSRKRFINVFDSRLTSYPFGLKFE